MTTSHKEEFQRSIVIVTAPSGTGKTTLTRRLIKETPDLSFSVSVTTRPMRKGETDGEHYWFVNRDTFLQKEKNGDLIEWAEVFGNFYGTTKQEIKRIEALGHKALLEIDVQGAKNVRSQYPNSCSIFIMPPSLKDLWQRLSQRGTDTLEVRMCRLYTAGKELAEGKAFQHFIINDNLEKAFSELKNLVMYGQAASLTYEQGLKHCAALIEEFNHLDWLPESLTREGDDDMRKHE